MGWGGEESEEGVLFLIFFVGAEMMFCLVVRLGYYCIFFFPEKSLFASDHGIAHGNWERSFN